MERELTEAQERALIGLADLLGEDDLRPSIQEWADQLGLDHSTVKQHRNKLRSLGFITDKPGTVRSTRITDKAASYINVYRWRGRWRKRA